MTDRYTLGHTPHLFPNMAAAVAALSAYVAKWSGYLQYEITAVHSGGERAFDGYHVRAKDFDGFGVGYIDDIAAAEEAPDPTPPPWRSNISYAAGARVQSGGVIYVAANGVTAVDAEQAAEPSTDVLHWTRETPDLSGGDPGYRLIYPNGAVILTLETPERIERKAAFATVGDAEAYLNLSTTIDPIDLEAGRYGIDAPHGLSDDEAIGVAEQFGATFTTTESGVRCAMNGDDVRYAMNGDEWSVIFYPNKVAAAHAANSTVEP